MPTPSMLSMLPPALVLALGGCAADAPTASPTTETPALARAGVFPDVIPLPAGFWPEGIDVGRGTTFYVGSIATGAVYRGDLRTGAGDELVPANPERSLAGLRYDHRRHRLFAAGGPTGTAYVFDASSGATLAVYQLADPTAGPTLVNDVVLLRDAAYFTDSYRPILYRVSLGKHGALPSAGRIEVIPLSGDFEFLPDALITGNANGIVATPDERHLVLVNTTTGRLYRVDPRNGQTVEIDLGGASVVSGDGLLLVGHTLYVVQGELNQVAVVRLSADLARGEVERVITGPGLDFPSTVARFGRSLYVVNARFGETPGPGVEYWVTRLTR